MIGGNTSRGIPKSLRDFRSHACKTVLLLACSGDDPASPDGDTGKISTGEMTQVLEETVGSGGTVTVPASGAAHFSRDFSASVALANHFDNDRSWFRTPKVWDDDVSGIKFCAEVQKAFVTDNSFWTSGGGTPFDAFLNKSEEDHFWSLCYYPSTEGTITFDFASKSFRPYTSTANARALQE